MKRAQKYLRNLHKFFRPQMGHHLLTHMNHKIVLKDDTPPISTSPYRYPHYQKIEIEKKVAKLLTLRVIRLSSSPLSSHVLLVRKADESWCLCMDYQALNRETIKDKFLIPIIDELLDELYGVVSFSKLDLRYRCH